MCMWRKLTWTLTSPPPQPSDVALDVHVTQVNMNVNTSPPPQPSDVTLDVHVTQVNMNINIIPTPEPSDVTLDVHVTNEICVFSKTAKTLARFSPAGLNYNRHFKHQRFADRTWYFLEIAATPSKVEDARTKSVQPRPFWNALEQLWLSWLWLSNFFLRKLQIRSTQHFLQHDRPRQLFETYFNCVSVCNEVLHGVVERLRCQLEDLEQQAAVTSK